LRKKRRNRREKVNLINRLFISFFWIFYESVLSYITNFSISFLVLCDLNILFHSNTRSTFSIFPLSLSLSLQFPFRFVISFHSYSFIFSLLSLPHYYFASFLPVFSVLAVVLPSLLNFLLYITNSVSLQLASHSVS